jgi:hypothetical protein
MVKNIVLGILVLAWFVATVMIAFTIVGLFFIFLIDEWVEIPILLIKNIN